jgi:hypothetical protein
VAVGKQPANSYDVQALRARTDLPHKAPTTVVLVPLPPAVGRAIDQAVAGRTDEATSITHLQLAAGSSDHLGVTAG